MQLGNKSFLAATQSLTQFKSYCKIYRSSSQSNSLLQKGCRNGRGGGWRRQARWFVATEHLNITKGSPHCCMVIWATFKVVRDTGVITSFGEKLFQVKSNDRQQAIYTTSLVNVFRNDYEMEEWMACLTLTAMKRKTKMRFLWTSLQAGRCKDNFFITSIYLLIRIL